MLMEQTVVDKIEILEDGQIQVRQVLRIFRDGMKIAETYHRHCLAPGDDLKDQDPRVAEHATLAWKPEVVKAFQDSRKAQTLKAAAK